MTFLILGILLWVLPHSFKRMAPAARRGMGAQGRAMVAGLVALGVLLMIIGYRMAPVEPIYSPLPGMGASQQYADADLGLPVRGWRHQGHALPEAAPPDVVGHGDLGGGAFAGQRRSGSILLFGSLGLWALNEMRLINRTAWVRPTNGRGIKGDAMNLVGTLVLYGLIAAIHIWLGHNPFMGTYG